jgi:hypothetical protein
MLCPNACEALRSSGSATSPDKFLSIVLCPLLYDGVAQFPFEYSENSCNGKETDLGIGLVIKPETHASPQMRLRAPLELVYTARREHCLSRAKRLLSNESAQPGHHEHCTKRWLTDWQPEAGTLRFAGV